MTRRFQFSLRTLLVAFLIVSAWVGHNANMVHQRKAMQDKFVLSSDSSLHFVGRLGGERREQSLPWLRRALGDQPIEALSYMPERDRDGSELRRALELFPEAKIRPFSQVD